MSQPVHISDDTLMLISIEVAFEPQPAMYADCCFLEQEIYAVGAYCHRVSLDAD